MNWLIISITLQTLINITLSFTIRDSQGRYLIPKNDQIAKETTKCGITYKNKIQQSQIFIITDTKQFSVSVISDNQHIHVSGYAVSHKQQNFHKAQLLIFKKCIQHQYNQIDYAINFNIYQQNKSKVISIKAVSNCNAEEYIQSLKSTISLMYALMWVISLSFLPVFPDPNKILPKLIIIFYMVIQFLFQIHPIILLPVMLLVYRLSIKSYQIGRNYDIIHQAILSQRAFISLTIFFSLLIIINFLATIISSRNDYFYEVGIFFNISIHFFDFAKFLIHGYLFCKLIWLNRFRDLCYWLVSIYIICTFASFLTIQADNLFFNFLKPSLFSQKCQYKNISFIFLMMPVSLYMKRLHKNWQFLSSLLLIFSLVINDFQFSFFISIITIFIWSFLQSIRIGYMQFIRFRWITSIHDQY